MRTMTFKISCYISNSITFWGSPVMRNQVVTQKGRSQLTSTRQIILFTCLERGSENNDFKNTLHQIQFYHVAWAPWDVQSSRNKKGAVRFDFNSSKFQALYSRRGGGGRLRTMSLRISCSKSKSITFYGFPGILNQVETQKEQSQLTSLHQISKHYLRSGGSENNDFKNKLPQIQILSRSRGPLG